MFALQLDRVFLKVKKYPQTVEQFAKLNKCLYKAKLPHPVEAFVLHFGSNYINLLEPM
jgi:hypothetical protein